MANARVGGTRECAQSGTKIGRGSGLRGVYKRAGSFIESGFEPFCFRFEACYSTGVRRIIGLLYLRCKDKENTRATSYGNVVHAGNEYKKGLTFNVYF